MPVYPIAFDGRDIRVTKRVGSTPFTLALFSHHFSQPKITFLWGRDFVEKYDLDALFFSPADNHWWNTPEFGPAVEAARAATSKPIVGYGCSMGGTGALLAFERAITIGPQATIDRAHVPWEHRWAEEYRRIDFIHPPVRPTDQAVVIWDPQVPADNRHADLMPDARKLPLPGGGHRLANDLAERGVLAPLVMGLASGELSLEAAAGLLQSDAPLGDH